VKRRQRWSSEEIKQKIQEWVSLYGEIPAATDWHPGDCRRSAAISLARAQRWNDRARRFSEGEYPWPMTVQKMFGSWNAAIKAAGFEPRREAMPPIKTRRSMPSALKEIAKVVNNAMSAKSEIALQQAMMEIAQIAMSSLPTEMEE
jgi:hypothetical protein